MILDALRILAPTGASMGYALFLALNAASVWGGVFPFLPLELQTPAVSFWFFLAQTLAVCASFVLSALGSYWLPGSPRAFWVRTAGLPYVAGWGALVAALLRPEAAVGLAAAGGTLIGCGSAGFALLWQRLFAGRDAEAANRDLLAGTAWAALLYYGLCLVPQPARALVIPLAAVPLFSLAVLLNARKVDRAQPMFSDAPRANGRVYRQVLRDHWRSALCVGAVGLCAGIMRAAAVTDPEAGWLVNGLSMAGVLVITLLVAGLWSARTLSLSIVGGYKSVLPFLITSLLALPLLGEGYGRVLAAVIYAVYSGGLLLMVMQCAQTSRDRGVNPAFAYGYFGAIVFGLNGLGFLGGACAEAAAAAGIPPRAAVALVALWALGMMHFVGSGGFSRALGRPQDPHDIELAALDPPRTAREDAEGEPGADERREPGAGTDAARGEDDGGAGAGRGGSGVEEGAGSDAGRGEGALGEDAEGEPGTGDGEEAPGEGGEAKAPGRGTANGPTRPGSRGTADGPARPDGRGTAGAPRCPRCGAVLADDEGGAPADEAAARVRRLRAHYRLSAREAEVVELIARGHSVARIAETLVVTENTIRTHSKRIYAKLGIHKKQELVDLIERMAED